MPCIAEECAKYDIPLHVFASHKGMIFSLMENMDKMASQVPEDMAKDIVAFATLRDQMIEAYINDIRSTMAQMTQGSPMTPLAIVVYKNNEDFEKADLATDLTPITHRYMVESLQKKLEKQNIHVGIVEFDKIAYEKWLKSEQDTPVMRAFWAVQYMQENKDKGDEMDVVEIYTDGACLGNPGRGGWGTILRYKDVEKELSGGYRLTTNNRMEITAVLEGLSQLKRPCVVHVYSDSKYVCNAKNENWLEGWIERKFWGVKNADLWQKMLPLLEKHDVKFNWVKGHNGHPENERCDVLAVQAANGEDLIDDVEYLKVTGQNV